ncbi:MAG TPA: ribbon-helix-helix domain-containing protein [Candidatus Saccharimonadales bacterium]|nr:ribbon-helix-helix domain-containing protein [Candidatus Saccharimonadales bacterium]
MSPPENPHKRRRHTAGMQRITISIQSGLLDIVDKAAEEDFTTRSDIIRAAILWYLRPHGRELAQTDPETVLKTLQHRRARAAMKDIIREMKRK